MSSVPAGHGPKRSSPDERITRKIKSLIGAGTPWPITRIGRTTKTSSETVRRVVAENPDLERGVVR